ncbi:MAG TPA: helix-turn-helix domain-containing protein [Ktedonobacterales bacterium]|nr:helix-turn-helix domain-containing protein [Ktedonobacterales bacterium]
MAAVLLRLTDGREGVEVPVTHREIGDMIGELRETVSKILDEFQACGLVELRRGHALLRDPKRLRRGLEE